MTDLYPFGESTSSGDPNIGVQKFCGASVSEVSIQADWAGYGGKLGVTLVEDTSDGDKFVPPVINQPKYFQILDVNSGVVFSYGGVVESINRESAAGSAKVYSVNLASPSKILSAVTVNMNGYAGYGGTVEGVPQLFSKDGYYDIGPRANFPEGYAPIGVETTNTYTHLRFDKYAYGSNNNNPAIDWTTNYNVMNVFGAYENDDYYLFNQIKGYGSAGVSSAGMRFDRVMFALHDMINQTNPGQGKRYLGGNILFGTTSYNPNVSATPYYYGFDAIGFFEQVYPYLPGDYRIPASTSTLLEIIQTVCEEANMEFIVEMENSGTFPSLIDTRTVVQTYPNSSFGGVIYIRTFPKNAPRDSSRPYSILSSVFLGLEIPDIGNHGSGNVNPGVNPVGYADPFEDDYTYTGTDASQPYGGKFPVAISGDYAAGQQILNRVKSLSLSVQATDQIASRFVVGGKQSRVVRAGRDNIYQYWGDLSFVDSFTPGSSGTLDTDYRKIPVVTPILSSNDINDFILIDTQEIFSTGNICNCVRRGIYVASVLEIRMAMKDIETWRRFMEVSKPKKLACFSQYVKNVVGYSGLSEISQAFHTNGLIDTSLDEIASGVVITLATACELVRGIQDIYKKYDTTTSRIKLVEKKTDATVTGSGNYGDKQTNYATMYDELEQKLYDKIRAIGDEHYGQSWFVAMPYPDVKLTVDDTNIVGNFEKSWDLAEDAYLEPYAFNSYEAPRSNIFVKNGRISPYVNYEHSFNNTSTGVYLDIFTNQISYFESGKTYQYDFKEYDKESIVLSYVDNRKLAHTLPDEVSDRYHILPPTYFTVYDRTKIPFHKINNGSYSGVLPYDEGTAGDQTSPVPEGRPTLGSNAGYLTGSPDLGARMSTLRPIIDSLRSLSIPDHGLGCIHFAKVKTKRVYYPTTSMESYSSFRSPTLQGAFQDAFTQLNGSLPSQVKGEKRTSVLNLSDYTFEAFPAVVPPLSIALTQTSNRYFYGPWITSYVPTYAGKVEYVQDDELVPENFLLPEFGVAPNPYDFNFNLTNTISGLAGLNLAGQAKANSIDGSSVFAEEQGTLVMAGAPLITKIGDALYVNNQSIGPYITDISIKLSNSTIETTYNFRTYTPRQNRTNRDIVKKITQLSNTVKKVTSRNK